MVQRQKTYNNTGFQKLWGQAAKDLFQILMAGIYSQGRVEIIG
jgi:hypothetical protein